jgi:P4 family phage/plasmid primase-like protien
MDNLTILTCRDPHKATKKFTRNSDGSTEKHSFIAGWQFSHEEKMVTSLQTLAAELESLLDKSESFVIRGAANDSAAKLTRRKGIFFDAVPRHYVMLDIDKLPCPAHFDAAKNPEEITIWALEHLPAPFKEANCYYKFSASQNIGTQSTISLHLWFWLDKATSNDELKRYFKANHAPVDLALFSSVQMHYTARPIFIGWDDPLPQRSGLLERKSASVPPLDIPAPEDRQQSPRSLEEPKVTHANRAKAIDMLLPYYQEGLRDRFCGAIAGVLYRGGWSAINTADFIYDLAERAEDEDADARYGSALRICDAIDNDRPAQGIPTLKRDIGLENPNEILILLGIGKPDLSSTINGFSKTTDLESIREVMAILATFPESDQKAYIDRIKLLTGQAKGVLSSLLKEAQQLINAKQAIDWSDITMERLLRVKFEGGRTLIRAEDGRYWQYNGRHWEPVSDDFIKSTLLPYARDTVAYSEGRTTVSAINNAVLNTLSGRAHKENNPLHTQDAPSVINCLNGELWFDASGNTTLKPHRPESYLKHCLNVEYSPASLSPMFDKAVLDIFSGNEDMVRHFMELVGYICQPWRKLPIIVLLYGHGSNGKSSLMGVVQKILGRKMIMSDRISKMEDNPFKIGGLDGKLLLLNDDVDEGSCLEDGFLKKISEEKLMTGQHKHKPLFEFICRAVPVMLANNYPAIKDLSYGVQRRIIIIPFLRQFKKEEIKVGLFDQIWEQEASGILNRFVEGFQRLKQRGYFQMPEPCIAAQKEWLRRANILPTFIEECCEIRDGCVQPLGAFYSAFREYCSENGIRYVPSQGTIGDRLEKLAYAVTNLNGKKHVRGLRVKETSTTPINLR